MDGFQDRGWPGVRDQGDGSTARLHLQHPLPGSLRHFSLPPDSRGKKELKNFKRTLGSILRKILKIHNLLKIP